MFLRTPDFLIDWMTMRFIIQTKILLERKEVFLLTMLEQQIFLMVWGEDMGRQGSNIRLLQQSHQLELLYF